MKQKKFKLKIIDYRAEDYSKYRDFSLTELFELFLDEEVWTLLIEHTLLYATFKGDSSFIVDRNEMKVFVAIRIISDIVPVSSRHLFWKTSKITCNEAIYNSMKRNKFDKITQYLHFPDNTTLNTSVMQSFVL